MGMHGSAARLLDIPDIGDCCAEFPGEKRHGRSITFQMTNEVRIGEGMQGLASGSIA